MGREESVMMIFRLVPCLFFLVSIPASVRPSADLKSLVQAERAFARLSEEKGIRTAFLANLAPDSVVFRPTPVPGRKAYEESGEIPGRLTWRPTFADISRAGDLGYTTGPYMMRPAGAAEEPPGCGHYVSIWRVQPDGRWMVVIDVGVRHTCPPNDAPELEIADVWMPETPKVAVDIEAAVAALLDADRALAAAAGKSGSAGPLVEALDEGVRVYRPGLEPIVGLRAARDWFSGKAAEWKWAPAHGGVSASGDLGYTYGHLEVGKDPFSYFRIWRKASDAWTIVLDVISPVPTKYPVS
jgi:ketosteroid isomerase-like protein